MLGNAPQPTESMLRPKPRINNYTDVKQFQQSLMASAAALFLKEALICSGKKKTFNKKLYKETNHYPVHYLTKHVKKRKQAVICINGWFIGGYSTVKIPFGWKDLSLYEVTRE